MEPEEKSFTSADFEGVMFPATGADVAGSCLKAADHRDRLQARQWASNEEKAAGSIQPKCPSGRR
jgi:hypothetical protein